MKLTDIKRPLIIAGPCSAETRRQTIATCTALAATGRVDMLRAGVWKPRTHPGTFEGAGMRALAWLAEVRHETGLPVAVEVAGPRHVESALKHGIDTLWIGARTTVSPFAVQDIADAVHGTGVTIFIKNPVNPDLDLWGGAVERFAAAGFGAHDMALVHRGFSCYGRGRYRNAPMWHLAFEMRSRFPQLAMLADPSHMGGERQYVREIAQTAADLRYDGLMIESHTDPGTALSDASQQLTPADTDALLGGLQWRVERGDDPEFVSRLDGFRMEIDRIDAELFSLLGRRMSIAESIGEAKRCNNVAILQGARWRDVVNKVSSHAARLGLSDEFVHAILEAIHTESIARQNTIINK